MAAQEELKLEIVNDGKEKHESWEAHLEVPNLTEFSRLVGQNYAIGYGRNEEEALQNLHAILRLYSVTVSDLLTQVQDNLKARGIPHV